MCSSDLLQRIRNTSEHLGTKTRLPAESGFTWFTMSVKDRERSLLSVCVCVRKPAVCVRESQLCVCFLLRL